MKKADGYYLGKTIPALAVTALVFLLPVGAVLLRSLTDISQLWRTITDRYTWKLLGFTVMQASVSALCSIVLAMPFAAFFSRYRFRGRRAILTMCDAAFALPAILVVLGFVICYGNNGLFNRLLAAVSKDRWSVQVLYSFKAIILAHVYLNLPIALSLLTNSLSEMPTTEENASRLLGASDFRTFVKVTLPKVWGTVLSAFSLIFLFCFPSFLIVMTLGGNPSFYTIEAEIYKRTYTDMNPAGSASLAMISFAIMAGLLVLTGYGKEERRASRNRRSLIPVKGKSKVTAIVLTVLLILFMAPPILSILYRSFFTRDGVFTLKAWSDIAARSRTGVATSLNAVLNSIGIAACAAFIATELASSVAIGAIRLKIKALTFLTSLPMAMGSVSLGLGFLFLASSLQLRSIAASYILVLLAHTVVVLPFAVRTLVPGARAIPACLPVAAKTLGGTTREIFRRIESPLLGPYRRRAFAFAFALSLGEVNATLALGEGRVTTTPVLIYKLINQYNYQGASALAVILIILALTVFAIGEKGDSNAIS
ncbi:MAG: iron ABC transporter permease [Spirochaetales bacterium]|nr:iron ABC transporter permease [Spirochaetales bacterium]